MNDDNKELLHLAAKAYGLPSGYKWRDLPGSGFMREPNDPCEADQWWNPLKSDGDALRLLFKIKGELYFATIGDDKEEKPFVTVKVRFFNKENEFVFHTIDEDILGGSMQYVRKAIVRAASEIGKSS